MSEAAIRRAPVHRVLGLPAIADLLRGLGTVTRTTEGEVT
jgi:hypothetical protein